MSAEVSTPSPLDSDDIAKVLLSDGPVVKCVLLKAPLVPENGNANASETNADKKEAAATPSSGEPTSSSPTANKGENGGESKPAARKLLREHMEEVEVDTTPSKSMVSKLLGGPFTFLGQYEDEGIVLMIRKLPIDLDPEELPDLKPSLLRDLCKDRDIPVDRSMLYKEDLIKALTDWSRRPDPPFNPHQLQPPLHNERVRGDILVLKVAETKEELDSDETPTHLEVPSNDEFFLDYTLDEYIQFASRTDIPEYEVTPEEEAEGSENEEEDDEEAEEEQDEPQEPAAAGEHDEGEGVPIRMGDEEELDEEDKAAMFNLVMNEVLRQYREELGRGPDTKELLEMRATIAKELDVQVAEIDAEQADWNKHAKLGTPAKETAKTIGFIDEDKVLEYEPDPNEHSHHAEYDMDDEHDYEGEPTEDDEVAEESLERPKKRIKIDEATPGEVELEDSKPAAVATAAALEPGSSAPSEKTPEEAKKLEENASGCSQNENKL